VISRDRKRPVAAGRAVGIGEAAVPNRGWAPELSVEAMNRGSIGGVVVADQFEFVRHLAQ
jgi:hypothetical protein